MLTKTLKALTATLSLTLSLCGTAHADPASDARAARAEAGKMLGFVPRFLELVPDLAVPGLWQELTGLEANPKTALPCRYKQLIGLAVAAQIPCPGCVYGHTRLARVNGATDAQLGEAVAIAGLTRHWSTFFNGMQLDEGKFRGEIKQLVDAARKAVAAGTPSPAPLPLIDARSALDDMQRSFGFVPEFARMFPPGALPGAWRQMRDVELNPTTAISGKYKTLISVAVASQIPCRYCLISDTELARLEGATDQEIAEAVAMAAFVRNWSTLVGGLQMDEAAYRKDMDRIARAVGKLAAGQPATTASR
jgi:AhpD family alkylhydroperoxidase